VPALTSSDVFGSTTGYGLARRGRLKLACSDISCGGSAHDLKRSGRHMITVRVEPHGTVSKARGAETSALQRPIDHYRR